MSTTTGPGRAGDDDYYERLAAEVGADDWQLPTDAVVTPGRGELPGRDHLTPFLSDDEMEAATRRGRGRPRLSASGSGHSPKRQVRLPVEVDAALVRLARDQGRTPSAVMRQAIEDYVRSA